MDPTTRERLAEFICGDDQEKYPTYRPGPELTRFFARVGLPQYRHDGSTRKWWVLEVLKQCKGPEMGMILRRLASPKEYGGDPAQIKKALFALNTILRVEGLRMEVVGAEPKIGKLVSPPSYDGAAEPELKPLPPPNFAQLGLEAGLGDLLGRRWDEAHRCVEVGAHLSGVIMMGSLLEGMLLGVLRKYPQLANQAKTAPKDESGAVKKYREWTLAQMIEVAHELRWLGLDIKRFSHALREFRNLVHPYEQLASGENPDGDTCRISWLVVQAAANDLARALTQPGSTRAF